MEQNKLKLEDCMLTLEQAKELKGLGVVTDGSLYIYGENRTGDREPLALTLRSDIISGLSDIEKAFDLTDALTNTEMLEMLPQYLDYNKKLSIHKSEEGGASKWVVSYVKDGWNIYNGLGELLRDALFEMIRHLKMGKLI